MRVLDAVKACFERWGMERTTIDDVARQSEMSRATLYRLFPGGREVIFEAHRVHELDRFFATLVAALAVFDDSDDDSLHGLLSCVVATAMSALRADEHIAVMLASEPGKVIGEMTVDGLPRIIRVATAYMVPFVDPYLPRTEGRALIDLTVRLVISYFLAPSDTVDLCDEACAAEFIAPFVPDVRRRTATTTAPHVPATHISTLHHDPHLDPRHDPRHDRRPT